ncbi:MAG: hypothetical protein ACR2KG_09445 [Nocardioidaceae bacterium]
MGSGLGWLVGSDFAACAFAEAFRGVRFAAVFVGGGEPATAAVPVGSGPAGVVPVGVVSAVAGPVGGVPVGMVADDVTGVSGAASVGCGGPAGRLAERRRGRRTG